MSDGGASPASFTLLGKQSKGSWVGRIAFGSVGVLLVTLQLIEFGEVHGWNFLVDDFSAHWTEAHWGLWRGMTIILLQSLAAAAVISIALTYIVVTNTFNTTTIEASEELTQAITDIQTKVAGFGQQLEATKALDSAIMKDLLHYAASQQHDDLRKRLEQDERLFERLVIALSNAVADVNKTRGVEQKPEQRPNAA